MVLLTKEFGNGIAFAMIPDWNTNFPKRIPFLLAIAFNSVWTAGKTPYHMA